MLCLVKTLSFVHYPVLCGLHLWMRTRAITRAQIFMAFITEDGFWVYKHLPFGLKNAPAHFQRAIDTILGCYHLDFALAYIDDVIIFSCTLEEHLTHVEKLLEAFKLVGLTLNKKKCHFSCMIASSY